MLQIPFDQLSILQEQIKAALETSNFKEIDNLSKELEAIVTLLITEGNDKKFVKKCDIEYLVNLLNKVKKYQKLTEQKFKDYTSRVSKSRKMHEGYKQARG